jgi:hypothetical protein
MKQFFLMATMLLTFGSVNAQDTSLTKLVLQDSAFLKKLDSLGLLDIQTEAEYDDSYLRNFLPLVFGPNGEYYYNEFAKKSNRANFYHNSLDRMEDISKYYQNHIKGFESDSMTTNHYTDDLGDVRENYILFKKGVKVRLIQLFFIQGIQFKAWDDETEFIPRSKTYKLIDY